MLVAVVRLIVGSVRSSVSQISQFKTYVKYLFTRRTQSGASPQHQHHLHMRGGSMPNTSEGGAAPLPGPAQPSRVQRPGDVEEQPGLITSFARDAARVRRASSAELHLPWTCPGTHSREKFYTVCSDHALLNQAASVHRPPNTARDVLLSKMDGAQLLLKAKPSADVGAAPSGGAPMGSEVECDMMEVSSGNRKPILAWEIDTTDFNAVLTRKTRAGKDSNSVEMRHM